MCYDISKGLLCDCKIFVNLRIAFVSSSDQRSSEQTAGDGARLQGQMWNVPSHRRDNCRHRDTRPRAGGGAVPRAGGGGGTQQLVMIHTCCEVSIRRAAIQCLRITHSPSHNHQAVRYKWFDLETLSYTECKKWLDIRRRRDSPRYANMISNMQYRLPKIFFKYSHWHSNIQTCSWDQSTARNTTGDIQLTLNDTCNDATHTNYKCD